MGFAYFSCFLAILFFSTIEVVGKGIGNNISPLAITFYRFLIGAVIILPFALKTQKARLLSLKSKDFFIISLTGVLNIVLSMMFLQLAIYYGKASLSAIIISTNPLFVSIFALYILKEKLPVYKMIGLFVGLAGIALIILGEKGIFMGSRNVVLGIIFSILASITFGLYTVVSKKAVHHYGNYLFITVSFFAGTLILLAAGLILRTDFSIKGGYINYLYLIYLGIFVTGLAYIFFFKGLSKLPAANGSMFFFLKPVIASLLAVYFLNEEIYSLQIGGIILIVVSIGLDWVVKKRNES